jgi:hypothetical protein
METLMTFARYELGSLLAILMAVVAFQMLTGRINTRGMISEKTSSGIGSVSPSRLQLLLFTGAFAFYVVSQVIQLRQFPEIETKWLMMLGGSHSVFLGGKGLSLILNQTQNKKED